MVYKGICSNSIHYKDGKCWVHKNCSSVWGSFNSVENFKCIRCKGKVIPLEGRPVITVAVGRESLEVIDKFCYLLDTDGGAKESSVARVTCG